MHLTHAELLWIIGDLGVISTVYANKAYLINWLVLLSVCPSRFLRLRLTLQAKISFWKGGTAPSPDSTSSAEGDNPFLDPTPLGASTPSNFFPNFYYVWIISVFSLKPSCLNVHWTNWARSRSATKCSDVWATSQPRIVRQYTHRDKQWYTSNNNTRCHVQRQLKHHCWKKKNTLIILNYVIHSVSNLARQTRTHAHWRQRASKWHQTKRLKSQLDSRVCVLHFATTHLRGVKRFAHRRTRLQFFSPSIYQWKIHSLLSHIESAADMTPS